MSETTDGVDERTEACDLCSHPAASHIDEGGDGSDDWCSDCSSGSQYHVLNGFLDRTTALEARAERAERALLKTWFNDEHDLCGVCVGRGEGYYEEERFTGHTPDCIIPELERRYA